VTGNPSVVQHIPGPRPRSYLREHREQVLGWTRVHAAKMIGVHETTVARWESGVITMIRPVELTHGVGKVVCDLRLIGVGVVGLGSGRG
jgi:DNA-binding XRE family transcriptional regulator